MYICLLVFVWTLLIAKATLSSDPISVMVCNPEQKITLITRAFGDLASCVITVNTAWICRTQCDFRPIVTAHNIIYDVSQWSSWSITVIIAVGVRNGNKKIQSCRARFYLSRCLRCVGYDVVYYTHSRRSHGGGRRWGEGAKEINICDATILGNLVGPDRNPVEDGESPRSGVFPSPRKRKTKRRRTTDPRTAVGSGKTA